MSRAFGNFFASNSKPCACTTIDTVSNFHISCSWKLDGACQIFKLMGAATLSNFHIIEAASPRQILYTPEAATAAFSRGRQLSWNTNTMRSSQNLNLSEKLLLLLLFPFYYTIFLKKFQIFFAHKERHRDFSLCPCLSLSVKIWLT